MRIDRLRSVTSWTDLGLSAGLAVCLVVGTVIAAPERSDRFTGLDFWAFALVVIAAFASVAVRRTAPVWGLAGAMLSVSVYLLAGYPYGPVELCMVIAMFAVARRRELRVSALTCGLAAVGASVTMLVRLGPQTGEPVLFAVAWTSWIVLPWSLGALAHVRAVIRERARRDLVARVALEERMRIAAEVHDVAGHGFAVVAMQAGVALLVFDEQPDQARKSIEAIQATSVRSLNELRGMLDTFHSGQTGDPTGTPDPAVGDVGLAGLDELVDQVRTGGLPVQVEMRNMDLALAKDIDVVVYRVVQESLTNVLRHAGPAKAGVRLVRAEDELLVEVLDDGRGRTGAEPPVAPGLGCGLAGMRDRVEAVGGRFHAGPREGGGFQVVARLPLTHGAR